MLCSLQPTASASKTGYDFSCVKTYSYWEERNDFTTVGEATPVYIFKKQLDKHYVRCSVYPTVFERIFLIKPALDLDFPVYLTQFMIEFVFCLAKLGQTSKA